MGKNDRFADVVICGAGMAGVATAYYLSKSGINNILLVDKYPPLSLTSSWSAECYRNWWSDNAMIDFANRSIDLIEDVSSSVEGGFYFNRRGYGFVSLSEETSGVLRKEAFKLVKLGPVRVRADNNTDYSPAPFDDIREAPPGLDLLVDNEFILSQYPYLSNNVKTFLHARRCGWIGARDLGTSLLLYAKKHGAQVMEGEVVDVVYKKNKTTCVNLIVDGSVVVVKTNIFVNAAGPFIEKIGRLSGENIPVICELHEKILIKDDLDVVPRHAPMLILNDSQYLDWSLEEKEYWQNDRDYKWLLDEFPPSVYLRPEGGEKSKWLLIGWSYKSGSDEPHWAPPITQLFPEVALRGISKLIPGMKKYFGKTKPLHDGGYYTKAMDNKPIIGPLKKEGNYIVGALSGYGIMTGWAAGELCTAYILGNNLPSYSKFFSYDRFEDSTYLASLDDGHLKHGQL